MQKQHRTGSVMINQSKRSLEVHHNPTVAFTTGRIQARPSILRFRADARGRGFALEMKSKISSKWSAQNLKDHCLNIKLLGEQELSQMGFKTLKMHLGDMLGMPLVFTGSPPWANPYEQNRGTI